MSLTKEQWQQLEEELGSGYFGKAELKLGEDEIILKRELTSKNTIGIAVYINGKIKASWCLTDSEDFNPIVENFWRKRSKSMIPPKRKKAIIKVFGVRRARKEYNIDEVFVWYDPIFTTFGALKRNYKKLENLELIGVGYQ